MAIKKAAARTAPAKPAAAQKKVKPSVGSQRTARKEAARRNPAPAPANPRGIKVIATQMGYYDLKRRREGDVFYIKHESEFSSRWMERTDKRAKLRETGAQEALDRKHDDILGGRAERPANLPSEPDDDDDDNVRE